MHSFGLLRGSFRPADVIVVLRSYLRQREMLVQGAAAHVQHMQKALELMNVKLTEVLDDITGLAGRQIIESILEGKRDPVELAKLRDPRCQRREETIALALQGNWRDEHLFALRQGLELYRVYQQKLHELDQQIETHLKSISASCVLPPEPLRPRPVGSRKKSRNEPAFDLRTLLHRLSAVDLTTINGIGPHAALQLISEIGTDMTAFPSVKHFCSWLCLCPGTNKTGGRTRSRTGKTRPSANRAARVLRLCAQSVIRAD
ncbi:MAG: transposase, partial [Planctomycetia bacterium]|nr:transposase [Planctomycetia bacterium]